VAADETTTSDGLLTDRKYMEYGRCENSHMLKMIFPFKTSNVTMFWLQKELN
jgi:hypothetical protein